MEDEPSFVTIVSSLYGGDYESGPWLAFACWPEPLPDEWNAGDVECKKYFDAHRDKVGGGAADAGGGVGGRGRCRRRCPYRLP